MIHKANVLLSLSNKLIEDKANLLMMYRNHQYFLSSKVGEYIEMQVHGNILNSQRYFLLVQGNLFFCRCTLKAQSAACLAVPRGTGNPEIMRSNEGETMAGTAPAGPGFSF